MGVAERLRDQAVDPRRSRNLPALCLLMAASRPTALALDAPNCSLTYSELADAMLRVATAIGPGDRPVVVRTSDSAAFVTAALGVLAAGRSPLLLDHRVPDERVRKLYRIAKAERVIGHDVDGLPTDSVDALLDAPPGTVVPVDDNVLGTLLPTSGSTGTPKIVARTRSADFIAALSLPMSTFDVRAGDRWWMPVPVGSVGFLSIAMGSIAAGATLVLDPFDPETANEVLAEREIDIAYFVPTMLRLALSTSGLEDAGWRRLRALHCGGELLDPTTRSALDAHFAERIWVMYGATEIPNATIASPWELRERPTTVGRAARLHAVCVIDPATLEPLAPGQEGEVAVAGPDTLAGYLNEDGTVDPSPVWHRTGDIGRLDDEGYLFLSGRATGFVKVGGNRVSPVEATHAIEQHPAVAQAAVVAVPDQTWGHRLHAFVVPEADARVDQDDLIAFARQHLSAAASPRLISFVSRLPVLPSGKVDLQALRQLASRRQT